MDVHVFRFGILISYPNQNLLLKIRNGSKFGPPWLLVTQFNYRVLIQIDYRKGPSIVRTRLSVAVAAFTLHAMQGPWPGAIGHTIKYLKAQGGVELALQVLVLIPEEFTSITFTAQSKVDKY